MLDKWPIRRVKIIFLDCFDKNTKKNLGNSFKSKKLVLFQKILTFNNLKLPKNKKLLSYNKFKSEGVKWKIYTILVVSFANWTISNIKKNGQINWDATDGMLISTNAHSIV